jgi:hypothetical protein
VRLGGMAALHVSSSDATLEALISQENKTLSMQQNNYPLRNT